MGAAALALVLSSVQDAPKEEGCWEECCALAVLHVSRLCVPGLSGHEAELLTEAKSQVG